MIIKVIQEHRKPTITSYHYLDLLLEDYLYLDGVEIMSGYDTLEIEADTLVNKAFIEGCRLPSAEYSHEVITITYSR